VIKAIETRYAGCRFRSRLEARWAVLFNHLGIVWEYEPQGFELSPLTAEQTAGVEQDHGDVPKDAGKHLGYYLPDFRLPQQNAWFEVKGAEPPDTEWARLTRFDTLAEGQLFVAVGSIPDPGTFEALGHPYDGAFDIYTADDVHYAWTRCRWCNFYDLTFDARSARTQCGCHTAHHATAPCCNGDKCYNGDHPAIPAARSARFEHGESGA
jgi:hypothetical protein